MTPAAFIIALAGDNILSIDGSFLFIFTSVLLLIFVLNRTLFRPINAVLDERERMTGGRLAEARLLLKQYEERLRSYEGQIRAARVENQQQLEAARRAALAARQEVVTQVRAEAAAQIEAARGEIGRQAEEARAGLEREARGLAAGISAQILRRPVSPQEGGRPS